MQGASQGPWARLAQRAVEEYRAVLGDGLVAVACFGSVARGRAGPESDLDLYVVTADGPPESVRRAFGIGARLRESPEYAALEDRGFRPDFGPIIHTVAKLKSHPWILLDIADHGVILHDPEAVLARELEAVRCRLRELGSQRIELPDGSWYWDLKPDWRPGEVFAL